ncbi:hypothetical protein AB9F41_36780, partial [Rhizobium leguminosarum]|uniref:hypothetical protein n=1 Tax=Rhizobium leguminosarum TaxID=384 RepID=UPI003F97CB23
DIVKFSLSDARETSDNSTLCQPRTRNEQEISIDYFLRNNSINLYALCKAQILLNRINYKKQ